MSHTFEDFLKTKHADHYMGTDDDMPDAFEGWLEDIQLDGVIAYAEEYGEVRFESGRKDERKRIHKAFLEVFTGAGELLRAFLKILTRQTVLRSLPTARTWGMLWQLSKMGSWSATTSGKYRGRIFSNPKDMSDDQKKNRGKLRTIRWRDSRLYLTQCGKDDDFAVSTVYSTGFVVSENKRQIVLAGDIIDEDIRRVIVIPKENIF
jgi:hypothetical protein